MVDLATAVLAVAGFLIAAGMLYFSLRVSGLFGRSMIGRAWLTFTVAAGILCVISLVALAGTFESLVLPLWWREGSALVFRLSLLYALYRFYRAWKTLS